jgi:multidrug efflux pump subunit AcrA (membrane-fusion protein)
MPTLRRAILLLTLATLPLLACGREASHPAKAPEPPVVRGVTLGIVTRADVDETAEVTGTVKSRTTATVSSRIMGRILALHVREGSHVEAGQVIAELDDQDTAAQLRRAEAGLAEAEASLVEVDRAIVAAAAAKAAAEAQRDLAASTLARYQRLLDRKSVAPQEYDQVAAQQKAAAAGVERAGAEGQVVQSKYQQILARIEAARAEIAGIQIMRGYARITAPFAGIVTVKHMDVGSMATPGAPLVTLEDSHRYWLEAVVPASQVGGLKPKQSLRVAVEAAGYSGPATVSEIVPVADPATRTTQVRLDLPDSGGLRAGLFGRIWVPVGRRQSIEVARGAVVERGELQGVYVVGQDSIARFRLIRTGATRQGAVEVLAGLSPGEQVVLSGVERVTDGARIQP